MRMVMRAALASACLGIASTAMAGTIAFDPYGTSGATDIQVASFALLPGSALVQNIIPAVGQPTVGQVGTAIFQARLGNFLDSTGHVILVPGLNDPTSANVFQITVTAEFNVIITSQTTSSGTITTNLTLAPTQPTDFIHYYYNKGLAAVDLAGTGFTAGTLIASGTVTSEAGVFSALNSLATTQYDNFGNNDYPGITSISGIGGTTLVAGNFTTLNPSYFLTPGISTMSGNSTDALAFNQANPAQLFLGSIAPQIGAANGISGPDIEYQTQTVTSFNTVPEPASLLLLGLGAGALLGRRRRG